MHRPISELMERAISQKVFPGGVLRISLGEELLFHEGFGVTDLESRLPIRTDALFDLASLTKPLATALAVMVLIEQGPLTLASTLASTLPEEVPRDKREITVEQLLRHTSGLPAHKPYYQSLCNDGQAGAAAWEWDEDPFKARRRRLRRQILHEPLLSLPGERQQYSDLGYVLLCWIIETVGGEPLDQLVRQRIYLPMGISDLFFIPRDGRGVAVMEESGRNRIVPTERCPWREKTLKGEVHDDNAWCVGGVEGHAGLFGTAEAVWEVLVHLMSCMGSKENELLKMHYRENTLFCPVLLNQFLSGRGEGKMVAGFDTPSPMGSSSGRFFSNESIGHLGFTGTSFWLDPKTGLIVVLLTNRVHPHRDNDRIRMFRPRIHDAIVEVLGLDRVEI